MENKASFTHDAYCDHIKLIIVLLNSLKQYNLIVQVLLTKHTSEIANKTSTAQLGFKLCLYSWTEGFFPSFFCRTKNYVKNHLTLIEIYVYIKLLIIKVIRLHGKCSVVTLPSILFCNILKTKCIHQNSIIDQMCPDHYSLFFINGFLVLLLLPNTQSRWMLPGESQMGG